VTSRGLLLSAAKAYGLSPSAIAPELGPIPDARAVGIDWASIDPHSIGRIYERQVLAEQGGRRKAQGAFYTRPAVARLLVEDSMPLAEPARGGPAEVMDPACGCGSLLVEALRYLCRQCGLNAVDAASRLRGLDRDPDSVLLARVALLAAAYGLGARGEGLAAIARRLARSVAVRDALACSPSSTADCILMNPPYVRAATDGEDRESLRRRFSTACGAFDLHVPFVELAIRSVRPGGSLGLLTTDKLLVADYGRELRALLAEQTQLIRLVALADCADASPEALVAQVAISGVRRRPDPGHRVEVLHPKSLRELECGSARAVRLAQRELLQARWPALRADGSERAILAQVTSGNVAPLGSLAVVRGGVRGFDYRACCRELAEGEGQPDEVAVLCPGNIRAWRAPSGHAVRLAGRSWAAPCLLRKPEALSQELWQLFAQPKLVVKGVGARPTAALSADATALFVAVWGVWGDESLQRSVLALLNSTPAAWLHYQQLYTARIPKGSLRVPLSWVAAFPVPLDALGELDQLAARRIAANSNAERGGIQKEIDLATAKAYGLSESELRLMEQAPLRPVQD
jgi:hypothetical protein